ncbi:FeoA family protein [Natronospora cellulosivora (SeqCode)]
MSVSEGKLREMISYQENAVKESTLNLQELRKGEEALILATPENLLLAPLGLREGKRLKVKSKQIFGGPIVVNIEGRSVAIDKKIAKNIKLYRS